MINVLNSGQMSWWIFMSFAGHMFWIIGLLCCFIWKVPTAYFLCYSYMQYVVACRKLRTSEIKSKFNTDLPQNGRMGREVRRIFYWLKVTMENKMKQHGWLRNQWYLCNRKHVLFWRVTTALLHLNLVDIFVYLRIPWTTVIIQLSQC